MVGNSVALYSREESGDGELRKGGFGGEECQEPATDNGCHLLRDFHGSESPKSLVKLGYSAKPFCALKKPETLLTVSALSIHCFYTLVKSHSLLTDPVLQLGAQNS